MSWWFDWTRLQLREIIEIPDEPITITPNYPSLETLLVYVPLVFGVGMAGNLLCWWLDNKFEYFLENRIRIHERKLERKRIAEMWHP